MRLRLPLPADNAHWLIPNRASEVFHPFFRVEIVLEGGCIDSQQDRPCLGEAYQSSS